MVTVAQTAAAKRKNTRRALQQRVKELEEQLLAAGGETRKNLRGRIARLTAENAKLAQEAKGLQAQIDGFVRKAAEEGKNEQPATTG